MAQEESKSREAREAREKVIKSIVLLLRRKPFSCDFEVVEKPKGMRIIYEVTQEEMDKIVNRAVENSRAIDEAIERAFQQLDE